MEICSFIVSDLGFYLKRKKTFIHNNFDRKWPVQ
jgi:hypothetical protein